MQSTINSKAVKSVVRTVKGRQDVVVGRTNGLRTILDQLCASIDAVRWLADEACFRALACATERGLPSAMAMVQAMPAAAYMADRRARRQRHLRRVTAPDIG